MADPGGAFDCLLGPWIQPVAKDRFVLSPLLEGYAAAGLGIDGVRKYYGIAADAWLRQRSITPEQAFQMITTALLAPHEFLLLKVCTSFLSMRSEKFSLAAKQIAVIVYLDFGQMESAFSVISQFFFRHLQMKVAEENGDWGRYAVLDEQVSKLVEPLRDGPLSVFRLAHYVFTNCTLQSPIPLEVRLRRAIEARNIQEAGLGDAEFEGALHEYPSASLIAIAASTASTREELESTTRDLVALSRVVSEEVAESFDKNPELGLLLTERVWTDESKRAEPNWTACLEAFLGLRKFADNAHSQSLQAACARASMVLLDEFLNNSATALRVAAEFRESAASSRLIDLAEIGIRLRRREGDEALRLLERVENGSDLTVYALERVMALTRVLRFLASASDAGQLDFEKMARVVAWGERIGEALDDSIIGNLVRLGLECERGLWLHCTGQQAEAAEAIERVVSKLEAFPDQSFSVFKAVRFRVGQCCGLLGTGRWKGSDDKTPPVSMVGLIADFTDPVPAILDFPAASYPEVWGLLAMYAAYARNCSVARRCAERALRDGKEAYYVAANQGIEAAFLCDLLENHLDSAFRSGIEWTRVIAIGMAAGLGGDDRFRQRMNLDQLFRELETRVREIWSEAVVGSVLEPFFMMLCSVGESQRPNVGGLRRVLESHLGAGASGPFACLALMEPGLAAADGAESRAVEAAIAIAEDLSRQNAERRRLMMLACCASKAFSPAQLLSYQIAMLNAATKMPQSVWAVCLFWMLAKRWLFTTEDQKFHLSRPDRSAANLRDAAEKALRFLDVRSCAELLIAAVDAAALSIPREKGEDLVRLARS